MMDKRNSPRYAIELAALVNPAEGPSWLCSIRDFCAEGMLLAESQVGRSTRGLPDVTTGALVEIHFLVPGSAAAQQFCLDGRIVRVMDSGVGVRFDKGIEAPALDALLAHVNRRKAFEPGLSKPPSAAVKRPLARHVGSVVQVTDSAAPAGAEQTATAAQAQPGFAAAASGAPAQVSRNQSAVAHAGSSISAATKAELLSKIRGLAIKKLPEMHTALFSYMADELLGLARDSRSNAEQNDHFITISILESARPAAEKAFVNTVIQQLDSQQSLASYRKMRKQEELARKKGQAKTIKLSLVNTDEFEDWLAVANIISRSDRANDRVLQELRHRLGMLVDAWRHTDANPLCAMTVCHALDQAMRQVSLDKATRQIAYAGFEARVIPLLGRFYQSVARLLEDSQLFPDMDDDEVAQAAPARPIVNPSTRSGRRRKTGDDVSGATENTVNSGPTGNQGAVGDSGPNGDSRATGQNRLRHRPPEHLGELYGTISEMIPSALQNISVVENLVAMMEQDAMLSSRAKGWIRQLQLTLGKVATGNADLLDESYPHASLAVINQLACLGGAEPSGMEQQLDELVTQIADNYDSDPLVFDAAIDTLAPMVARQLKAFERNFQRTAQIRAGQQTLLNAQRAVANELGSRISGQRIPDILLQLLIPGWRNLMVNTHLRRGEDSSEWLAHIKILDQLDRHLQGQCDSQVDPGYIAPETLLDQIEAGLASIAFEPGKRRLLLQRLREYVVEGKGLAQMPMSAKLAGPVAQLLGFSEVSARDARRQQSRLDGGEHQDWQQWLDRAANIHIGDWLAFKNLPEDERIGIVAWTSLDHNDFTLVNRLGIKTHEYSIEELARKFQAGQLLVLGESDIPLSHRASHQMLQNLHNQLTHQAAHDAVTGLMNRKGFERALNRAFESTRKQGAEQLVAYFDLDQFKVINNAVGHDGGDKLLTEIGALMVNTLSDRAYTLARLGGDEFGLLLAKGADNKGLKLVKEICAAIRDYAFCWKGSAFSLTTSCGVMYMDEAATDVQTIMQCADTACFAAKDKGRNRVHVYQDHGRDLGHRRDIMGFVAEIDRALQEDRFILNCQLISPVLPAADRASHYEILLTVLDANDAAVAPMDYILAAESYNRMGAIDRWVISNVFQFCATNRRHFTSLGAFSINVSGNSLAEENFLGFVLDQFRLTGVPPTMICFEITETSAVGSMNAVVEFIEKLQVIGVQFSLDDFGTGLSSYSYLRNLPVDYLKIDGTFVRDIHNNPADYAVVKSINEIGHFLGKKTIAEYVENDAILATLRDIGVDYAQGFGVGKKMPLTALLPSREAGAG